MTLQPFNIRGWRVIECLQLSAYNWVLTAGDYFSSL